MDERVKFDFVDEEIQLCITMKHTHTHTDKQKHKRQTKTQELKSDESHMEVCRREVDLPLLKR